MNNPLHDETKADKKTSVKNNKPTYAVGTALVSVTLLLYFTFTTNDQPFGRYITIGNVLEEKIEGTQNEVAIILKKNANKSKIILEWSGPNIHQKRLNTQVGCGHYQCTLTSDRSTLIQSDAVIMTIGYINPADLPTLRFPWQRWIFKSHESPANHRPPKALNGKVNWTLTYHRSSDIPFPFGFYREKGTEDFGTFHVGMIGNASSKLYHTKFQSQLGISANYQCGCRRRFENVYFSHVYF